VWLGIFMSSVSACAPIYQLFQEVWKQTFWPLYKWPSSGPLHSGWNVCFHQGNCIAAKTSDFKPLETIDRLVRKLIHWTTLKSVQHFVVHFTTSLLCTWLWESKQSAKKIEAIFLHSLHAHSQTTTNTVTLKYTEIGQPDPLPQTALVCLHHPLRITLT